ncbi:MAG: VOC family protein [Alkalibacterium sp.]|nr:VOC family protein [Alkalibacterium sp.]
MKDIIPNLWFDKEAEEAAAFYTGLFDESRITSIQKLDGTPSGETTTVNFELAGQSFVAFSAGPLFKFNPSFSLMIQCSSNEEVDKLWNTLTHGGKELMALKEVPFSKRYGWLEDRYGLTWQILLSEHPVVQKIIPNFLFTHSEGGKAEDAVVYYTDLFPISSIEEMQYYETGEAENPNARVKFSGFHLFGRQFYAMDNDKEDTFTFNESCSLMVVCENQAEIDYYWEKLSAVPESEQCGWVKDQFGVSWQIVPESLDDLLSNGSKEQIDRVTQSFLEMKKLDTAELERVWKEAE